MSAVKRFSIKEAELYKKGLTAKQKDKWVKAANEALNSCLAGSGSQLECELTAIHHANSLFSKNKRASETRYITENNTIEIGGKKIETKLRLTLLEADETDEYQMILPVGTFHSSWYGEIIITPTYIEAMYEYWKAKVLGNREPFIDTLHDRGKANGWIEDLEVRGDGLYAKIQWTKMGEENIKERYFRYFSSDLGEVTDIETGDRVWPVLIAVALCNTPVMNTMPTARLSEEGTPSTGQPDYINHDLNTQGANPGLEDADASIKSPSAHGDGGFTQGALRGSEDADASIKNPSAHGDGGSQLSGVHMTLKELCDAYNRMTPEEQTAFLKDAGLSEPPANTEATPPVASGQVPPTLEKAITTLSDVIGDMQEVMQQFSIPGGTEAAGQKQNPSGGTSPAAISAPAAPPTEAPVNTQLAAAPPVETIRLEAKVAALEKANQQLTDQVGTMQTKEKDKKKSDVINAALSAGKIFPKDRAFWEDKFDKDPEAISEMLERMPKRDVFTEEGTGDGGEEPPPVTDEDRHVMKKLGLSEEDMKTHGGKVQFPANQQEGG